MEYIEGNQLLFGVFNAVLDGMDADILQNTKNWKKLIV